MAWDINLVTLVGRLTRDPELSYTQANVPVCKFSIASNRGTNPDDVSFFDIVAWNKTADLCGQNLRKGSQVIIEGRLKQNRYTDKEGQKRSKIEIIANNVQFIGSRPEGMGNAGGAQVERSAAPARTAPRTPQNQDPIDFEPLGDDEVPF